MFNKMEEENVVMTEQFYLKKQFGNIINQLIIYKFLSLAIVWYSIDICQKKNVIRFSNKRKFLCQLLPQECIFNHMARTNK